MFRVFVNTGKKDVILTPATPVAAGSIEGLYEIDGRVRQLYPFEQVFESRADALACAASSLEAHAASCIAEACRLRQESEQEAPPCVATT